MYFLQCGWMHEVGWAATYVTPNYKIQLMNKILLIYLFPYSNLSREETPVRVMEGNGKLYKAVSYLWQYKNKHKHTYICTDKHACTHTHTRTHTHTHTQALSCI